MWIVKLALRRPYTFVVLSVLLFLLGIGSAVETPKDIFPYINIPVVTIVWTYAGLPPAEMEGRIVTVCERALTTTVNDIEHTESQSYQGVSIVKVYFQPQVKVELAFAQVTSIVQTILRVLPPGSFPPFIIKYDASSVPIVQLSLSGQGLTEADLYDLGLSFIRPRLATVKGAAVPLPYGGKSAPDHGRHRPQPADVAPSFRDRCFHRGVAAESHSAGRHGTHRRPRIYRAHQLLARRGVRAERPARSAPPTAPSSSSRMSRRSAKASPCRPTSYVKTARRAHC